ncbi:hypothetical protein SEPCBS57363_001996 [Sporothrix epigloea]|uniref:DUF7770 domain-containing protein n=1 Tax=Sporothrix epigloea TaxID=1892477 RepID=A0ABP0DDD4_9PEZI
MDRNWDQDHFEEGDLEETVVQIHICAYTNKENLGEGEEPPTNHWATFLEISRDQAVRIDMAPGYGADGLRGKIEISSQRYRITDNAIRFLSFVPKGTPTVGDIVNQINSKGFQKYNFTPEWEGCRFWIFTLISHLEQQGIVESGSASRAWSAVSHYYVYPSGSQSRQVRQGTFRTSE